MPATFWDGWQLWEKMCFILGCGIVLVICGGCIKLVYNRHRLRKYTQFAAEKAQIREQLQRTASVNHGNGTDIPFGIRALESGIEVDGVWISGSNTPAGSTPMHSTPGSPTLSAMTEVPKVVSHGRPASDRASLPSQTLTLQTARFEMPPQAYGYDADRLSTSPPTSSRPSYQPHRSSGLRFSDSNELHPSKFEDRDAALAALEGCTVGFGPAEEVHEAHRRSKSWATTSWDESHDPVSESSQGYSERTLVHPSHHRSIRLGGFPNCSNGPGPEDHDEKAVVQDVKGKSAVYVPMKIRAPMSYEDLPDEFTYRSVLASENESSSSDASDPFITPTRTDPSSEVPRTSVERAGFSPEAVTLRERVTTDTETPSHNPTLQNTFVQYPHETIEQPRRSQVIRKINSGFEILRPGTFGAPYPSTEIVLGSINAANEQDNKREPKKLQRRRGDANLAKS